MPLKAPQSVDVLTVLTRNQITLYFLFHLEEECWSMGSE
jgi:hypothetical protein